MKDTWDTRLAKLRLSADSFVRQQEAHAKVREGSPRPAGLWLELLVERPAGVCLSRVVGR